MYQRLALVCMFVMVTLCPVFAGESGHYSNSASIKCGTMPPPGLYLRTNLSYYHPENWKDKHGDSDSQMPKLETFCFSPRLVWMTNKKILGADYGMSLYVPFAYVDLDVEKGSSDTSSYDSTDLYDIAVTPLILSWRKERFDFALGYTCWVPVAEWEENDPVTPGKDFYSHMFSMGLTIYPDKKRTWAFSTLMHYETHSEKKNQEIRPGRDLHIEWAVSKTLNTHWQVGMIGYFYWQTSDDIGADVTWDKDIYGKRFAAGFDIKRVFPKRQQELSIRYQKEYGAHDTFSGHRLKAVLTKRF